MVALRPWGSDFFRLVADPPQSSPPNHPRSTGARWRPAFPAHVIAAPPGRSIWGRDDSWIPVDRAHQLADVIPGADLEIIDGAGHLIHHDAPVHLATALHRWLATFR